MTTIDELVQLITNSFAGLNSRFLNLENKTDEILRSLQGIETRLGAKILRLESRNLSIEGDTNHIKAQIDKIIGFKELTENIDQLTKKIAEYRWVDKEPTKEEILKNK